MCLLECVVVQADVYSVVYCICAEIKYAEAVCLRKYWRRLVGTAITWFCYDVVHYGTYLLAPDILKGIFSSDQDNAAHICWQMVIANGIGLPAVILTMFLFQFFGCKQQQVIFDCCFFKSAMELFPSPPLQ